MSRVITGIYRNMQIADVHSEFTELSLKGNCSEKILLQNIFGFHVYITNIYVTLSTETVITYCLSLLVAVCTEW